jgi:hypothetical protein
LQSADWPNIEPRYARSIGLAVAGSAAHLQRPHRGADAVMSHERERWPTNYRVGVDNYLLFGADELSTITIANVQSALQVCIPVVDTRTRSRRC